MREHIIENSYAKFWIQDNWLLCCQYKPGHEITLDVAIDCAKMRLELSNGVTRPMFTDARTAVSVDKSAREYLKTQTQYINAGAFLIDSIVQRLLGGIFIALNKPSIPTKLFTNEKEAIKWLETYRTIEAVNVKKGDES